MTFGLVVIVTRDAVIFECKIVPPEKWQHLQINLFSHRQCGSIRSSWSWETA